MEGTVEGEREGMVEGEREREGMVEGERERNDKEECIQQREGPGRGEGTMTCGSGFLGQRHDESRFQFGGFGAETSSEASIHPSI
jgi:hypothetical protein